MPHTARRSRPAALAAIVAFASLLSCGRELTGPGGAGRRVDLQFNPVFETVRLGGDGRVLSIGDVVDFARVRVLVVRTNGDTAIDRMVDFPAESTTVRLSVPITLSQAATSDGEPLTATLKYINATGDTVFTGGPAAIVAKASGGSSTPPPVIPVRYSGTGADAASLTIAPPSFTGTINQQTTFTATVRDSANATMNAVPVAFTSTDSNVVKVNLRTGAALLFGARGSARVIAQTLTGQADTADVTITPTPSAIVLVSGGAQTTRQGDAFPLPVRVRVNAVDNLPIAGVPVAFAMTRGQGSVLPTIDTTDASGFAETVWTAGDSAGVGNVTATVIGTQLNIVVNGTQLSSAPTALTLSSQPVNFISGDTIAPIVVVVRDATADTVSGFNGTIALDLTGGSAGASLVGLTSRAAVNGVATFTGLTIDRAGTAFRVRATLAGVPPVLSNTFNVAAAPPRYVTVVGGAGQTAPPLSVLTDSVKVRVTNVFNQPVGGVPVTFAVAQGGGSIAPVTVNTDSLGFSASRWTLGGAGTQQVTATVSGIQPAVVNATIFSGGGAPALFSGVEFVSMTVLASRAIPIFVSPAAGAPVVATLTVADTTIAKWAVDSVVFTPGATLRTPALVGRAQGSTQAYVTSAIGTDTIQVEVETAALRLSGYYERSVVAGDTLRKVVRIPFAAPAGGVTVSVVSTDTSVLLVAPGSGRGAPAERCDDLYCGDEPMPGVPVTSILAPPSDSTTVFIPAGQTTAQVVVLTVGAGQANVRVSAPSFATDDRSFQVEAAELFTDFYQNTTPLFTGSFAEFGISTPNSLTRDVRVRLTVRDDEVARVDTVVTIAAYEDYAYDLRVVALDEGSTWIVAEAPGFAPDSFEVTVVQPQLFLNNRAPQAVVGQRRTVDFYVAADTLGELYAYGQWAAGASIASSSSDTTVMRAEFGGRIRPDDYYGETIIRGVAPGSAWLRVGAPGFLTDSVLVTVGTTPMSVVSAAFTAGVGQVHQDAYVYLNTSSGIGIDEPVEVTVTSSDPSIAEVLTPTLVSNAYSNFPSPRIIGHAPGSVVLTFAGPAIDTVRQSFDVVTSRLFAAGGGVSDGGTYDADSSQWQLTAYTGEFYGHTRAVADTVFGIVRSTNPSVVAVVDSTFVAVPGSNILTGAMARLIAPGSAQLIFEAPGYSPDTTPLITLRPYRLVMVDGMVAGVGLRYTVPFSRRSAPGSALPFGVTVNGPADVTPLSPTGVIAAGSFNGSFTIRSGTVVGTDTVIVSAPGLGSDTLLVTVGPSIARPSLSPEGVVGSESDVSVFLDRVNGFNAIAPADTTVLVITSLDSSIVQVIDDTIRIAPNGGGSTYLRGVVRYNRPGQTWIKVTDPSGRFASDSQSVRTVRRQLYASPNAVDLGMASRTYSGELYLYRQYADDDSVWVKLASSAPGVARAVQDSVLFIPGSNFAYYDLIAGDSVGGAIITASALGFVDLSIDVGVSRPTFLLYTDGEVGEGRDQTIDMYLSSGRYYYTRQSTVDIPIRLRSENTSLATIGADSVGTIVAGTGYAEGAFGPIHGVAAGRTRVIIEDDRVGDFRRATPGSAEIVVRHSTIEASSSSMSVPIGLHGDDPYFDLGDADDNGVWVRLKSVGGRVAFLEDSVFVPPDNSSGYYSVIGLTAGIDTVVLSADGFTPDTVITNVTPGRLLDGDVPAMIHAGDSVLVTLFFGDMNYEAASVELSPQTLTFSTNGGMVATQEGGTGPLTTMLVPVGATQIRFWMRSTGSGSGEVIITGPGLQTYRARFASPIEGN